MLQQGVGREQGREVANKLHLFIGPLEQWLDQQIDRRLVRTFFLALAAIVRLRHSRCGLLLSELGAHVLSPDRAPAGTKRLSNLLRSPKWSHTLLERLLWYRVDQDLAQLEDQGGRVLAIWDESVLEKPESIALEGLCPVRSSKAARLKRIKPGFYNPPGGPPVFVPGLQWLTVMVAGMQGPPSLAAMRWSTSRGKLASEHRTNTTSLLVQCAHAWGHRVLHVFDRGYAGAPWLNQLTPPAFHEGAPPCPAEAVPAQARVQEPRQGEACRRQAAPQDGKHPKGLPAQADPRADRPGGGCPGGRPVPEGMAEALGA